MPSTISKQKKKDPFKEHTNKSKLSDKVKKKTDRTRKDAPANDARINPPKNKTLKELEADLAAKHKKQKKAQEDSLNKTKIQPGEKTGKEKKAEQARKKAAEEAAKRNEKKTPPANGTKKKPPTNGKKPPANGKKPPTTTTTKTEPKKNKLKTKKNDEVDKIEKGALKPKNGETKKKKKMSKLERQNRARHGDETINRLQTKNKDFQAMKKKKMTKAEFIKKYPKSITAQKAAGLRR